MTSLVGHLPKDAVVFESLDPTVTVGPFCVVETARIGKGTVLGPYTHVMKNSVVGAHCHLEGCYIEGAWLGDQVKVWRNAHLMQSCRIGDGTIVGHGTFVADGSTVGKDCRLMLNVGLGRLTHIGDAVYIGPNVVLSNSNPDGRLVEVRVGDSAWIGTNAVTTRGVCIGRHAVVGAGSVVTKDVPDFAIVYGNPAVQRGDVRELPG